MLTWNSPISFVAGSDALDVMALSGEVRDDSMKEKGGEGMRKGEKSQNAAVWVWAGGGLSWVLSVTADVYTPEGYTSFSHDIQTAKNSVLPCR